ncbi:hypothetical protein TSOC_003093 [Tetrabaena socialis]|uniref:Uncharacterized protein n=1 Tax=Tetrabaena socialis TaxID=47790 RepID=A0A2J8ACF8_9CHLO|nr:hypothetical protein TSOC_003093 [Tetrabaena socialis]|eukprot:PNH10198.1 hypothetical protein TSOC_003093 [Tetrabaena socialis]
MHVVCECPCYERQFEGTLEFRGRDMCTIMAEGPPFALTGFLREVWDTRLKILRDMAARFVAGVVAARRAAFVLNRQVTRVESFPILLRDLDRRETFCCFRNIASSALTERTFKGSYGDILPASSISEWSPFKNQTKGTFSDKAMQEVIHGMLMASKYIMQEPGQERHLNFQGHLEEVITDPQPSVPVLVVVVKAKASDWDIWQPLACTLELMERCKSAPNVWLMLTDLDLWWFVEVTRTTAETSSGAAAAGPSTTSVPVSCYKAERFVPIMANIQVPQLGCSGLEQVLAKLFHILYPSHKVEEVPTLLAAFDQQLSCLTDDWLATARAIDQEELAAVKAALQAKDAALQAEKAALQAKDAALQAEKAALQVTEAALQKALQEAKSR